MYRVTVRDHVMIAHSLNRPAFGPAAALHGATYVIDAEFSAPALDENNVIIDIGHAAAVLRQVCEVLNYQNLDVLDEFRNILTTTEYLAAYVHTQLARRLGAFTGALRVTLHESHVASASYEAPLRAV